MITKIRHRIKNVEGKLTNQTKYEGQEKYIQNSATETSQISVRNVTQISVRNVRKVSLSTFVTKVNDFILLFILCGLVVWVSGYRYRGLGFDSRRYQIF